MDAFDPTIGALNTSLNLRMANQNVISANIANADTPGYKAKNLDFESTLRNILGTDGQLKPLVSDGEHIVRQPTDPVHPEVYDDPNGVESLDGNTVDRAAEMAKMAENGLLYDASAEALRRKLGMLKYVAADGGGGQ